MKLEDRFVVVSLFGSKEWVVRDRLKKRDLVSTVRISKLAAEQARAGIIEIMKDQ